MHALTAAAALGLPFVIAWNVRRREALARAMTPVALIALSATVVMGVAALLFILRAWPRPFTSAVVGLFPAVIGILPLLSIAYAALYAWQLRAWRPGPAVAGVATLGIAAVFAALASWSNNPDIPCRLVQFATASVAAAGIAVMVRRVGSDDARLGARIAFWGTLLQAGAGAWYLFSIPDLPHGWLLWAPVGGGLGFAIIVAALAFGARITRFAAVLAAVGMLFVATSMAALREGARRVPEVRIGTTSLGKEFATRLGGIPGLENFARIAPGIYRSAQPRPEAWPALKALGLKTVVNLRSHHSDAEEATKAGIDPIHLELHASLTGSSAPTEEEIRKFFEIVLDPKRQPVLFHCAQGKDRTGTMAALYRIEIDGWTPDEAIEEMRAFGYHIIYRELITFVKGYKPRGLKPVLK